MSRRASNALIASAAVLAILGAWSGGAWQWAHYVGKPLTTGLLLWLVLAQQTPVSPRYRLVVAAGMTLSLIGDVCLMLPWDLFLPGLVAFLLAHLCYIAVFAPRSVPKARGAALALLLVVAALNLIGLLPRIEPALRVPVLAYVAVLTLMVAAALARAWTPTLASAHPHSTRLAAIGAIFFMLSDSLLAWDKFADGIPAAALLVLGTYFFAQWCIARSVEAR
ncbi:MAG: lysoplasmalogenase [Lysobacteraceae bacterium]|nr:MAG: lysoplasmalogenase [Xanthomonadaceae bacterium]